jgi:hypothetical protein
MIRKFLYNWLVRRKEKIELVGPKADLKVVMTYQVGNEEEVFRAKKELEKLLQANGYVVLSWRPFP